MRSDQGYEETMASNDQSGRGNVVVNRRTAFGLAAAATAGIGLAQSSAAQAASSSTGNHVVGPATISTPPGEVVPTKYGKVRGYVRNGIHTFKGIPYGDDTGGANRWLPAKPPKPWNDTLSAVSYGPVCPHPVRADWGKTETQFIYDWDDGFEREDMLRVNIWTSSLGAAAKKPVMVWIHGGGYASGSCQELPSYDGENLAKKGVVLVSLNHRLNALGFMDVSQIGGPAFADSANVGVTDLVAALQWVKENIAAFGGDPGNVTIFGQSGGGSKVTCLMTMPSAKGLFHRAIVQSGGGGNLPDSATQQRYAAAIMTELGLGARDIAGLQKVDHQRLLAAGTAAAAKVNAGVPATAARASFGPTFDGRVFPERPFATSAPVASKDVPMIIGTVREEAFGVLAPLTDAELAAAMDRAFAARGPEVLGLMKAAFPGAPQTVLNQTVTGLRTRNNALRLAGLKAAQGGAPAYNFWFVWQPVTVLEGRSGSFHTMDLAFCFDNTARCEQATGDTPSARALATKMSQAWVNFAKTGNPSQPGLTWTPYSEQTVATMVWDNTSKMVNDPAGAARKAVTV
ncbi:MAG: Carboxylesterase, type [Caulobacteraceae bacterium]|nr:Carboxylesterase, type [Caulobacteraceae bacterium]